MSTGLSTDLILSGSDPQSGLLTRIQASTNTQKESEVNRANSARDKWDTASVVFEILTYACHSVGILLNFGAGSSFLSDISQELSFSAGTAHTFGLTCRGFAVFCSKKFVDQATIVNVITDSVKSGKMPLMSVDGDVSDVAGAKNPPHVESKDNNV